MNVNIITKIFLGKYVQCSAIYIKCTQMYNNRLWIYKKDEINLVETATVGTAQDAPSGGAPQARSCSRGTESTMTVLRLLPQMLHLQRTSSRC
jgi:hypothetical protein